MKCPPAFIDFFSGIALVTGVLLSFHHEIEAAPYMKGTVQCAETGLPLDSVRIASSLFAVVTRTESDGRFTLDSGEYRTCRPETLIVSAFDEYRVNVNSCDRRFIVNGGKQGPGAVSLLDLRGRLLQKSVFRQSIVPFPGKMPSPGIYIVNVTGLKPERVLVTDNRRRGFLERKHRVVSNILPHACPSTDTIIFCKEGYASFAAPASVIGKASSVSLQKKRWSACDIHNHTVLTDGAYILDSVLAHAFGEGGLDVLVNSEHGGSFYLDTSGTDLGIALPRWYSLMFYSWPKLLGQHKRYPGKILLQGLEWNCPGHEHASVGIIDDAVQPAAIAEFEYRFDFNEHDAAMPWLTKRNSYDHANAITAIKWLQNNHPASSYFFINHPSREAIGSYFIEHFRDFHNAAPDVFLGFEGMPGHHKNSMRGSYGRGSEPRNRTWGGADYYLAKVGGLWDALLGEGRHIRTIVDSDFHSTVCDFWPGEYAKTWVAVTGNDARAWLEGIRTGEIFIAHGDLISELDFSIDDGIRSVSMGGELTTNATELQLNISFKSPATNNNGDSVRVDHVDLIAGSITGIIDPSDHAYASPVNPTTTVVRRFTADDWTIEDGRRVIRISIPCTQPTYFRLRGTSLAVGTPGEVDEYGNPLMDEDYMNTEAIAWKDLWFYSNPIFVYRR